METIKSLLLQPPASSSSSSSISATTSSTNFDDLIKDHHPHVLAPLQPTKYTTSNGIINNSPNAAIDFIPPLPASNGKQPPVIVGVAVKRTLRKPLTTEEPPTQQDAWPSCGTMGSTGDVLERWHSDIFDCPSQQLGGSGGDCNNNNGNGTRAEPDNNGGGDLIDFSTEIEVAPTVGGGIFNQVKFINRVVCLRRDVELRLKIVDFFQVLSISSVFCQLSKFYPLFQMLYKTLLTSLGFYLCSILLDVLFLFT